VLTVTSEALLSESFRNRRFWRVYHFERQFHLDGDVARNRSMDRWIGEWCRYNFAAGSFHTKKLCSRLFFERSWSLLAQTALSRFVPPFGGVRGNVDVSSMARWKARDRLPISANWTFFASYHAWCAMSRLWSKSLCSKRGWVTFSANFRGKGTSPTNDYWHQKTRVPGLSYGQKIAENFNRLSRAH